MPRWCLCALAAAPRSSLVRSWLPRRLQVPGAGGDGEEPGAAGCADDATAGTGGAGPGARAGRWVGGGGARGTAACARRWPSCGLTCRGVVRAPRGRGVTAGLLLSLPSSPAPAPVCALCRLSTCKRRCSSWSWSGSSGAPGAPLRLRLVQRALAVIKVPRTALLRCPRAQMKRARRDSRAAPAGAWVPRPASQQRLRRRVWPWRPLRSGPQRWSGSSRRRGERRWSSGTEPRRTLCSCGSRRQKRRRRRLRQGMAARRKPRQLQAPRWRKARQQQAAPLVPLRHWQRQRLPV